MIANLYGPQILHFGRKHILFNRWSQIILQKASAIYSLTKVSFPKPLPTLNSDSNQWQILFALLIWFSQIAKEDEYLVYTY